MNDMNTSQKRSVIDSLPPKTAFIGGIVTAVLCLGTLGFLILGGCMLSGDCSLADSGSNKPLVQAPVLDPGADPTAAPASLPQVTDDDHVKGPKNAKLTFIEYSDFECPFCGSFHPTVQQALAEYPNDIRFVYRHFPLSFHPEAEPAALAAECAGEQGKFFEYHDALFENQSQLGDAYYGQLATQLGLNLNKFNDCVSSEKYLGKINAQAAAGAAAGVNGTPGSFIVDQDGNAQAIRGAQPYASVKAIIEGLL